jgi:hypothetical protein
MSAVATPVKTVGLQRLINKKLLSVLGFAKIDASFEKTVAIGEKVMYNKVYAASVKGSLPPRSPLAIKALVKGSFHGVVNFLRKGSDQ